LKSDPVPKITYCVEHYHKEQATRLLRCLTFSWCSSVEFFLMKFLKNEYTEQKIGCQIFQNKYENMSVTKFWSRNLGGLLGMKTLVYILYHKVWISCWAHTSTSHETLKTKLPIIMDFITKYAIYLISLNIL